MFEIQPLHDNGDISLERTSRKRRLSLQAGPEGLLFFSTSPLEVLKICKVSMERKTVPISLPVFWPLFSARAFYKAHEGPNFDSMATQYFANFKLRRHFCDSTFAGGNYGSKRCIYFFVTKFRFSDKCQKISTARRWGFWE